MLRLALAFMLISSVAYADDITLKLTNEQVQKLAQGIMKLPYEDAAPLLAVIQQQYAAQTKPPAPPKTDKK